MIAHELLKDHEPKHSSFQIEHFIIGSQVDDWAKYNQALMEISSRTEQLQTKKEDLILLSIRQNGWKNKIKLFFKSKEEKKIRSNRNKRAIATIEQDIKHTERELSIFIKLAADLKKKIGHIDNDKRKRLEAQSWVEKAKMLAQIDILTQGRPTKGTIEFILSLPLKDCQKVLSLCGMPKERLITLTQK